MKKLKWMALLLVVVMMGSLVLTACGDRVSPEPTTYNVKYYDGENLLKTEPVKAGGKATMWTPPDKGDLVFVGKWYVDAGLNRAFNFDTEIINADKNLYAGYAKAETEDTRSWAVLGNGKGEVLGSSAWGTVITDIHKLTKVEGKNQFTITLDLYKGDELQFATDTSWMNQRGVGYIDPTKMTMMVAGEEVTAFSGGGGIGETANKQKNIVVEYDGNYTFTLATFPDDDFYDPNVNGGKVSISNFDTITWEYNKAAEPLPESVAEYYIKGAKITNWADLYNPATKMTRIASNYSIKVYLKQGDEFVFICRDLDIATNVETPSGVTLKADKLDDSSRALFAGSTTNNIKVAKTGEYTITYDGKTEKIHAEVDEAFTPVAADYYLDGNFGGTSGCNWGQSFFKPEFRFTLKADTTDVYELKNVALLAGNEIVIQPFTAGATANTSETKLASYNFRYFSGTGNAFEAKDAEGGNFNIAVLTAGTYDITFDAYARIITITPSAA